MRFRFALLLPFCWQLARGDSPAIISSSPDIEENRGGSVQLSCTVQHIGDLRLQWSKIDKDRAREPVGLFLSDIPILQV